MCFWNLDHEEKEASYWSHKLYIYSNIIKDITLKKLQYNTCNIFQIRGINSNKLTYIYYIKQELILWDEINFLMLHHKIIVLDYI